MIPKEKLEEFRRDKSMFRAVHRILEDGRRYGDVRTATQELEMFAPLAERRKKYSFFKLARGWDKTSGLAAWYPLEELILGHKGQETIIFASDTEQGLIPLREIHGYLDRNPYIGAGIRRNKNEVSNRIGRIVVMSSDAPSSFGTKASFYVIDELHAWHTDNHRDLFYSIYTACVKRKDARLVVLTNAGAAFSKVYFEMIDKVKESEAWHFFETGASPPWIDETEIEEQRKFLPPMVYARLHGNVDARGAGNFITSEDLSRCVDPELSPQVSGKPGRLYGVGLDFGRVKDRSAVAICHREGNNIVLDDCRWWKGNHANPVSFAIVEEHLLGLKEKFAVAKALFDPHQTQNLMERLRGTLPVEEFNFSQKSWNELAGPFYQLLHYGRLRLYPDQTVETELLMLELKQTPQGIRFDHSRGGYSDIATAIALAALACVRMPGSPGLENFFFGGELASARVNSGLYPGHAERSRSGETRRHRYELHAGGRITEEDPSEAAKFVGDEELESETEVRY